MTTRRLSFVFAAALFVSLPLFAAPPDLGRIDFPNSGAPEAQEAFIRGVLLLHSFEFEDAAIAFRDAQKIDPNFALAYWGEAMTFNHPLWAHQDRKAALAALGKLAPTPEARLAKAPTEREKDFLRAVDVLYGEGPKADRDVAYMKFMDRLRTKYPDDLEIAAFDAVSILGSKPDRDFRTYMRAASVAEEVFAKNPLHPGAAHYLIHSYDDPIHAPLGLRAARVYAKIAPAASHAQHMIAHIFAALGDWDQVIRANEIAVDVSEKRLHHMGRPLSGRSHHALFWLEYALLQEGRADEAKTKLATAREDAVASPREETLWHYAEMRTAWIVNTPGGTIDLAPIESAEASLPTVAADHFGRTLEALRRGDLVEARKLEQAQRAAVDRAKPTPENERFDNPWSFDENDIAVARILDQELQAMILWQEGKVDEALSLMSRATEAEDARPLDYGPPEIVKPTHELRGEMLLLAGRPADARAEFDRALLLAPRRTRSLVGLAAAARASGDTAAAEEAESTLASIWKGATPPPAADPALQRKALGTLK